VEQLQKHSIPVLGICLGHQYVGSLLGSKVVNDKSQAAVGSFKVCLTDEGKSDPLFEGIPEEFITQYGHKDSLNTLPSRSVLLAQNERCKIAAFRHGNIYGVQFHPELEAPDFTFRLSFYPNYKILEETKIFPSPWAQKILVNFFNLI